MLAHLFIKGLVWTGTFPKILRMNCDKTKLNSTRSLKYRQFRTHLTQKYPVDKDERACYNVCMDGFW